MERRYSRSKYILLGILCIAQALPLFGGVGAKLVINEVMQSNIDFLMVDNDFPDSWVELYNTTDESINLKGWRIGTNADASQCYTLPATTVAAGNHIVIYCDKEANGLHTDFRVDSGKGSIYLFDPQGTNVDALTLKKMPAPNVAYGRSSDGADEWQYEFSPTPGSANSGGGAQTVLPQPIFSIKGGVFSSPLEEMVYITMPEGVPDDALIFYTFDGTEPGKTGRGKLLYFPIKQTTVIRAKIMSATGKGVPSTSVTHSYIIHPRAVTMPVVSLCTESKYLNDSQIGILSSTVNDGVPNYMRAWRRPLNIEYMDADGQQVFSQLGETAVSGVSSRENLQKSLKLYANKRFGTKTFNGQFWKDKPNVTAVKSMILRSGGNNSASSKINDALVQTLFGTHVDNLDWQAYQPVIVYLNGKYLGEYALRERSNEDYVESNYDGLEDIEMADETSYQTPSHGSLFADFYNLYHNKSATYADITAKMDEDNFLKTLCAEIYGMNTDYPTNNVSMWCPKGNLEGLPKSPFKGDLEGPGLGCRWRWILKDMDRFGMSLPLYPRSFDMIRYMFSPDDIMFGGMHHFDLYERMGKFGDFRSKFIDMMAVYLGDFLKPVFVKEKLGEMRSEIEDEVRATFSKLHISMNDFVSGMNYLTRAVDERPGYLYDQLNTYFKLGGVYPLTVRRGDCDVMMNGIALTEGDFDGKYFATRTLRLAAPEGCTWEMTVTNGAKVNTTTFTTSSILVPFSTLGLASGSSVSFDVKAGVVTSIVSHLSEAKCAPCYNLMGQRVSRNAKGIVIRNNRVGVLR